MGPLVPTVAVVAIVSVSPSFPVSVSVSLSDSISLSVSVTHGVMRRIAKDFISWLKKRGVSALPSLLLPRGRLCFIPKQRQTESAQASSLQASSLKQILHEAGTNEARSLGLT
ncbi:hypothetical protein TIFTF001_021201 [Ficus carica]|uniref:Uncharacterized protein n=1 Tax=Ficus carica TaxID=3494 RepID=A0AA88DEB8_FICCA|nr:hypothetical protein TIFTF001_021201 [Ficus carica]